MRIITPLKKSETIFIKNNNNKNTEPNYGCGYLETELLNDHHSKQNMFHSHNKIKLNLKFFTNKSFTNSKQEINYKKIKESLITNSSFKLTDKNDTNKSYDNQLLTSTDQLNGMKIDVKSRIREKLLTKLDRLETENNKNQRTKTEHNHSLDKIREALQNKNDSLNKSDIALKREYKSSLKDPENKERHLFNVSTKQFKLNLKKKKTNMLEISRENEISILKEEPNEANKIKRDTFLNFSIVQPGLSSSPSSKSITFSKQTLGNVNNLLTETKDDEEIPITKKIEELYILNKMDCIEDLHFEFVKFCIKSKRIINIQESRELKTKDINFNTVEFDEVDFE